jgi:hypothetical protein
LYRNTIGRTTGIDRKRMTPAADDALRQKGGSPASDHVLNLSTPRQRKYPRTKNIARALRIK